MSSKGRVGRAKATRKRGSKSDLFHVYSNDNPHLSFNLLIAALMVIATVIAPILDSWVQTIGTVLLIGSVIGVTLNFFSINSPSLHFIITFTPSQYHLAPFPSAGMAGREPHHGPSSTDPSGEYHPPQRSRSYIENSNFQVTLEEVEANSNSWRSSINELGYSTPVPGSPEQPLRTSADGTISVLFSESSKFISHYAACLDYQTCYSILFSLSESIIRLLRSQPESVCPPSGITLVSPKSIQLDRKICILPDDADYTRNEWNIIRNKNGLRIVTSKLSSSLTRWPIISSVGTIKATVDAVYKSVSVPDIFKRVDEFGGNCSVVDYIELKPAAEPEDAEGVSPRSPTSSLPSILKPEKGPLLIKYQEMKSVWPVQPRDYLVGQTGFDLSLEHSSRTGKFLIAKSVDPGPKDPYPEGHEGFVRASLTASAFLIVENEKNSNHSDLWTFLHCDMKGNLSGNGKIADFITQSQMPKFFSKLEAVAVAEQAAMALESSN